MGTLTKMLKVRNRERAGEKERKKDGGTNEAQETLK